MKEREKVLRWREALRRVATISGWDSRDRDESMLIEQVVGDISDRLFSESSSDDSKLVGMDYHIQQMNSVLFIDPDDVRMVGIWGMGGIGKTTIARAIYDRFSRQYEGRCFIANVKNHSPTVLQEKLLSEILLERNLNIYTLDGGFNVIKGRLCHKKVFIVLDDVDDLGQLKNLAGMNDWFGPGSRIIITTRDKHLLVMHGVNYIYKVEKLKDDDALLLFKKYAFKQDHPTEDYLELSNRFVSYTKGLPLALQVLGSNLYGKTISEWKGELVKLQSIPNAKIQDVLRISYDGLNDDKQQGLFLHIACFFNGENKDCVMNILQRCGFFPDIDLGVLIDKSLITISYNQLWVHDLLQEMGREVVRQESVNDPGKRSRLWDPEDVYHVLNHNVGTKMVEGIFLDTSKIKALQLNSDAFKMMYNLKLLKVYSSNYYQGFMENCKVHFPQGLEFLSAELRYLYWLGYPLKSLPSNFHPDNLIELNMRHSNLEQLWEGVVHLPNLKRIDLSHSQHLKETTDLSEARNLERLILEGCTSLLVVHSSIQYLNKLIDLNLKNCKDLRSPPETAGLESLTNLILSGCFNIKKAPEIPGNVKYLGLDGISMEELHPSIEYAHSLISLSLRNCKLLARLPDSFCNLKSLESLTLSGCSKLSNLPEKFWDMTSLTTLEAEEIGIKLFPSPSTRLRRLERLSLRGYKGENSKGLLLFPLSGFWPLKDVNLGDCNLSEFPEDLGSSSCLTVLDLSRNRFEIIPESIKQLSRLSRLKLGECKRLRSIPRLASSISFIDAQNCTSLETISNSPSLGNFSNCFKLNQNVLGSIMTDAQEKIEVAANKYWSEVAVNVKSKSSRNPPSFIIYPGSDIPEWFTHQEMGSSLTIQVHPHSNSTVAGLAVCAVVAFKDYCDYVCLHLRCNYCPDILDHEIYEFSHRPDTVEIDSDQLLDLVIPVSCVESDHVLVGYITPFSDRLLDVWNVDSIKISITSCHKSHLHCCKVKKWGYSTFIRPNKNQ